MHSLGEAMRLSREPDEGFITFAGHPERLHPDLPNDPEADRALEHVERQPLSDSDVAVIRTIIAETKAQEARRSDLTWLVVQRGRYRAMHEAWLLRASREHSGAPFHSPRHQSDRESAIAIEK